MTMVGIEYEFELRVILKRDQVPPCQLGSEARLGLTTWLLAPGIHLREDAWITFEEGFLK